MSFDKPITYDIEIAPGVFTDDKGNLTLTSPANIATGATVRISSNTATHQIIPLNPMMAEQKDVNALQEKIEKLEKKCQQLLDIANGFEERLASLEPKKEEMVPVTMTFEYGIDNSIRAMLDEWQNAVHGDKTRKP